MWNRPKPETLLWAEFHWQVARQAPEALAAWIMIYFFWEQTRNRKRSKGVRRVLKLHDAVTLIDGFHPAILKLAPAHGTSGTRLMLGVAEERDTALPLFRA